MQAIQCQENTTETVVVKSEQNRILKRNILDLAVDGKINAEDLRSPVRKEVKIGHERLLRRELEQWKELMKENELRQSVTQSNNVHVHTNVDDIDCILKADQMSFIAKIVDIPKLIEESHEFRYNFDFFLRLNKLLMNTKTDKSDEALDKAKQQAIGFNTSDRMHCEPFQPIET